jgi:hypothetical protein
MRPLWTFAAALALSACSEEYVYRPAVNPSATVAGSLAAYYEIPPEAPRGSVRIASLGFSRLEVEGGKTLRAIHLRMVVANNDTTPWTVDTREQRIDLPGHGMSRAAFVGTHGVTPPFVSVPTGGKRTVDLFYPLPQGLDDASHIPEFDVVWSVVTGARAVSERTPFDRLRVEPAAAYGYDWGPYWGWGWYDPFYPYGGFYDPAFVVPRPVWIHP